MSTIDTSTWNPDADLNVEIEGIPLNSDAGIAQTWQALRVLMAAVKGDGDAIKVSVSVKADDGSVVHLSGNELVQGVKIFQNSCNDESQVSGSECSSILLRATSYEKGTSTSASKYVEVNFVDSNGTDTGLSSRLGGVGYLVEQSGSHRTRIFCCKNDVVNGVGSSDIASIATGFDANGISFSVAPSTSASRNYGGDIVTRDWIPNDSRIVHASGNETISGTKTFSSVISGSIDGNAATASTVAWSGIASKPTTISGYAITDAKIDNGVITLGSSTITPLTSASTLDATKLSGTAAVNTSGTASNVTGTVAVANGGTGATIAADALMNLGAAADSAVVHLSGNETVAGTKTFSSGILSSANITIYRLNNSGSLVFAGGKDGNLSSGARLQLNGAAASANGGAFQLSAGRSAGSKVLLGAPDGTLTWDGQAIQTASDERIKTPLASVPDEVLDAWGDVNWGQFQFLEAVGEKGNSARLHLGLIAQRVKAAFEARGLDACAYGILCHEVRPATEETPAVDLWMVRYTEALAMEAAFQRRRADRLEARIAALEERLNG